MLRELSVARSGAVDHAQLPEHHLFTKGTKR